MDAAGGAARRLAPAKINLALHVTGRRADGYHDIDTLAVFAEAGDRLTVKPSSADSFRVTGPFAAALSASLADQPNIVEKARDLFFADVARRVPVSIDLEKSIPVAAGLGGGSADAAATLIALGDLFAPEMSRPALKRLGSRLGADVAMCLLSRPLRARGIGEKVRLIAGFPSLDLVLVNPMVAVSTPAVFRSLRETSNPPIGAFRARRVPSIASALARLRNDLEQPAIATAPVIADVLAAIASTRPLLARMSGSGATCFGLYASGEAAREAALSLTSRHPAWYVTATRTLASDPAL